MAWPQVSWLKFLSCIQIGLRAAEHEGSTLRWVNLISKFLPTHKCLRSIPGCWVSSSEHSKMRGFLESVTKHTDISLWSQVPVTQFMGFEVSVCMWADQGWGKHMAEGREQDKTKEAVFFPQPNSRGVMREILTPSRPEFTDRLLWERMLKTHEVYLETLSSSSWKTSSNTSGIPRLSFNQLSTTGSLVDFQSQTAGTTGSPDLPFHHDKWQWLIPDADWNKQNSSPVCTVSSDWGFSP